MAAKKEEAFEHVHSGRLLLLGRCLFSYEAEIANSCRLLHLGSSHTSDLKIGTPVPQLDLM